MLMLLRRLHRRQGYTIGRLWLDGEPFCDTLEDRDRQLSRAMGDEQVRVRKVAGETAIPTGRYSVRLSRSYSFSNTTWARQHGGLVPEVLDVPGFTGIRIHPGNTTADTRGCVLVGKNTAKGKVTSSRETWHALMDRLEAEAGRGGSLYLEVTY